MTRREWVVRLLLAPGLGVAGGALVRARSGRVAVQAADDEIASLALGELSRRLSAGTLQPTDVVEAYLRRIASIDTTLHAYVTVAADLARAQARALGTRAPRARGALYGIPIAHKDLFETAGVRTTGGSRLFEHHVPSRDAALVAILTRAGAVTLGKTNTHELGGGVTTINPFFGTTSNPVDPSRIAGGSSGGSAAAVAAKLAVAATGSDTGGSVRIPAAFCGCVGFKPTFGLISTAGVLGACPTFDHVGFLTRSVEDAARLFEAALAPGRQASPESRALRPEGLRIGVARRYFFEGLQPGVARAIEAALDRCRASGTTVVDCDLPVDETTMGRVLDPIVVAEIRSRWGADWKRRPEAFSPAFAGIFSAPEISRDEVANARRALMRFQAELSAALDGLDAVATPAVPVTAPPIAGPIDGDLILRNTWPFNAARTPAVSLPCGTDESGLPVGLQLTSRAGTDEALLAVAAVVGSVW
jgi:aspartyl-tRNA(Asn)/glutamyl-tRNA(Gln) amidotransferase subunit A